MTLTARKRGLSIFVCINYPRDWKAVSIHLIKSSFTPGLSLSTSVLSASLIVAKLTRYSLLIVTNDEPTSFALSALSLSTTKR
jgi:hypothetical protein